MQQATFQKLNTCVAWLVFVVAATVYCLTVEPTASLWDCPEFIACGYKLEIGHPPGAPVFMLAANLFSQFAGSPSQVALMVNVLSALLSAGCIFFLFLTITHLTLHAQHSTLRSARRDACQSKNTPHSTLNAPQVITIEACGLTGALAYTFSDTFWFSAVEAEVYAFSSFLTALMFWLILKWEREADNPRSDRWMILIAYVTGLSIGVHLLCLLCLPAMSLVVYYRKTSSPTLMGLLKSLLAGFLLVAVILYGFIPGIPKVGGWFELLFTNVMGLPYNTGLISYLLLLSAGLVAGLVKTRSRRVRTLLSCVLLMLIGYSSYGVIFIRANANTPMCENAPGNIFALGSYLNREQYGDTPLLYGPSYSSEPDYEQRGDYLVPKREEGAAVYRPSADSTKQHYDMVRRNVKYLYKDNMFFPRMHSARHAQAYEDWLGGVSMQGSRPTIADNLRFFFSYQMGFMYWRYFMWNFVGRQNNIQGHGEVEHGNWITGINWVDNLLLGCDTSRLPSDLANNKGRNVFFALPLLLGLAGIAWQWGKGRKGRQQVLVVSLLFLMTGLAIVVYLNQTPLQPRERDYAYAGSFYAFAVWIGLGAAAVCEALQKVLRNARWSAVAGGLLSLLVPLQMVSQTWDDHDRSGRYTCRDFGANYLESMQREGNPIILTDGDNDTFPLWYNHEVEGVRTDTRDCNLEYLQTDWYIDQMKRPAYHSPALPISWQREDYREGHHEYVLVRPELKRDIEAYMRESPEEARRLLGDQPFELKNIISRWVLSSEPDMQCIPTDSVTITSPEGVMTLSFKGIQALYKNDLMVLEVLSKADWKRPVYTAVNLGPSQLPYLHDHLVLEGLAYRVTPDAAKRLVDADRLYENVMHRFRFGGLNTKGIYVDEDVRRMANTHQLIMGVLIDALLERGDRERALAVCRKWQQEMPNENVPYTDSALSMARCFYLTGHPMQADQIVRSLLRRADEWLSWIATIDPQRRAGSYYSASVWLQTMHHALSLAAEQERTDMFNQYSATYENFVQQYPNK